MAAREQLQSLSGKSVLLIDQNANSARVMQQRLAAYKMQAQILQHIHQLQEVDAKDLALIMVNVEQNNLQTTDFIHAIRASGHLAQLPVLAIVIQAENREKELDQLGASYLLKPVRESHLAEALLQLLFVPDATRAADTDSQIEQERRQGRPNLGERFPLRMLVVDDNPTNRKVAGMMLERFGYQSAYANDGREAVDQILAADAIQQAFDVVWMDLHMPVLDGLESTKIVRSSRIQQPRIIAVTAAAMHGDREICLQAGMDDYVSKPLESKELKGALERYLKFRGYEIRQRDELEQVAKPDEEEAVKYFDPNRFMAFCEGNPAYRTTFIGLIQNMVAKAQGQFENAQLAWHEQRIEDAARVFHTMRGSMGTLGAIAFVETSRALESAIKAEQTEIADRLFVEMKSVLDLTMSEAQAWLDQQSNTSAA
jgi:CheY-like chemotaxis protein